MTNSNPQHEELRAEYTRRYDAVLTPLAEALHGFLINCLKGEPRIDPIVKRWFNPIEFKDHVPESEWEFGYFGRHYVLAIPSDIIDDSWDKSMIPRFFEMQVKTLFEHAWSEAEHDLGYKPGEQ